jgi:hypothetical protein
MFWVIHVAIRDCPVITGKLMKQVKKSKVLRVIFYKPQFSQGNSWFFNAFIAVFAIIVCQFLFFWT